MLIAGRCHCANISFVLNWVPEPAEIPARTCSCSFCVKHGGVWTSCPGGSLRVIIDDPARASIYAFGTMTARFHVCSRCGIVPVATNMIEGRLYAVVNVNTFEGIEPAFIRKMPASFDGENEATRLARRKNAWIADVQLTGNLE